jgi:hypothetical protein
MSVTLPQKPVIQGQKYFDVVLSTLPLYTCKTARCGFFESELRNSEAKIEILLPSFDQINLAWTGAEDMQLYPRNAPVLTPVSIQIPVEISILPFPFKHIE